MEEANGSGEEMEEEEELGVVDMVEDDDDQGDEVDLADDALLEIGADVLYEDMADDPDIDPNYQSDSSEDVDVGAGDQLIITTCTEEDGKPRWSLFCLSVSRLSSSDDWDSCVAERVPVQ